MNLAISGKKNSGKDTAANLLAACIGEDSCFRTSFAKPIKDIIHALWPHIPPRVLWGPSKERDTTCVSIFGQEVSVRKLMQKIGKIGRSYDQDLWIKLVLDKCSDSEKPHKIISDCRFVNEFNCLKKNNYTIIKIVRNNNSVIDSDVSETDLDNIPESGYDYILDNNGSLAELSIKIRDLYYKLKT